MKKSNHQLGPTRAAMAAETPTSIEINRSETVTVLNEMMDWQERNGGEIVSSNVIVLWSGEVLLNGAPGGIAGPFYDSEDCARDWTFCMARNLPPDDVFSAQLIRWRCAEPFAAQLVVGAPAVYDRLARFWRAPIRSRSVVPVSLPSGESA